MEADEKKCPQCAETVKAAAKVCRFCGHQFEGATPASAPATPTQAAAAGGMATGAKIGIGCAGLFVLLVILGLIIGPEPGRNQGGPGGPAPAAQAQPPLQVTARQLAAAYEANEAAAQQQYGNRVLEVRGKIASVQLGMGDEPFIVLEGTNPFMGPQANLSDASQPRASSLSRGQDVRLRCQSVSEIMGTAMLRDCDLI